MSVHLHVATDGVEAMAFLRREGAHANAPRPDFILLDLNLPKMDGREVLAHIKKDDSLKTIPTVDPDHLRGGSGHREELSTPSQLLSQQARAIGRVRELW